MGDFLEIPVSEGCWAIARVMHGGMLIGVYARAYDRKVLEDDCDALLAERVDFAFFSVTLPEQGIRDEGWRIVTNRPLEATPRIRVWWFEVGRTDVVKLDLFGGREPFRIVPVEEAVGAIPHVGPFEAKNVALRFLDFLDGVDDIQERADRFLKELPSLERREATRHVFARLLPHHRHDTEEEDAVK